MPKQTTLSFWKGTKRINQSKQHNVPIRAMDGLWIWSNPLKAMLFAKYEFFEEVFQPNLPLDTFDHQADKSQ